jgi:spore coat protein H
MAATPGMAFDASHLDMPAGSFRRLVIGLLLTLTLRVACGGDHRTSQPLAPDAPKPDSQSSGDFGGGHVDSPPLPLLVDDPRAYDPADQGLVDVSVTVLDERAFTAVQADMIDTRASILFAATDYGAGVSAEGTIELRGSTSREAIQKSYQIKLAAGAAPWRGSRTINLLKHPFDLTRVRNALSFESFRHITNFSSMRRGFVHLFIDSVDQGLYEWVEEPDETFFARHGLDARGSLYKAKSFTFEPIDNATAVNDAKVTEMVAAKGTPDLAKLRRMLAAVNDRQQPINDVLAHYFNRENYVTWLAVNVLMADFDSISQNFMLFSPAGFEGWYFLPWDYDAAWGWSDQPGAPSRPRWREGIANWWRVILHQRFLAEPANLAELDARIAELMNTINDASTAATLARFHDQVASFISASPDLDSLPCDYAGTTDAVAQWEAEYLRIAGNVSRARDEYRNFADRPMPFWLNEPIFPSPRRVLFSWRPAFQLHGQAITYDIEVNANEHFDRGGLVAKATDLGGPIFSTDALPPGHYFWRVVAHAAAHPNDDWQTSFNDHLFVDVP